MGSDPQSYLQAMHDSEHRSCRKEIAELEARLLEAYLQRAQPWSEHTFGPGKRTVGITRHIEKECQEIRENPADSSEWIDIIILGIDGYWRAGGNRSGLTDALFSKLGKNQAREWPKAVPEGEPVEHLGGNSHRIAELEALLEDAAKAKARVEQLDVQLAGCGVAALGGTQDPATKGQYGWSASYQDVLDLRLKYEAQQAQVAALGEAVRFTKEFLLKLEGTGRCDPLTEIRRRFHAPLHAKLDAALPRDVEKLLAEHKAGQDDTARVNWREAHPLGEPHAEWHAQGWSWRWMGSLYSTWRAAIDDARKKEGD